ncbi:glycosyltransferase [Leptolyngbya sp. 7M]|nr:glycosyltransferase [Leptolyngbya sp. 7M]
MTCRRLADFARSRNYPYLVIYACRKTERKQEGSAIYQSLKRSSLSFPLDEELAYDPLFQRHTKRVLKQILEFKPDVIHITGVNDVSIIGAYLAWKLQIPLVGSWHTNVHEFAAQRLSNLFRFLPENISKKVSGFAEQKILDGAVLYYKMPKVVLAPNQELVDLLGKGTERSAFLMGRGVDPEKFSPTHRTVSDDTIRLGFVGRLRAEKNVRKLIEIEDGLIAEGVSNYEFLIVGEGSEHEYLERRMKKAVFTGFLEGEELSEAYANMDIFLFPSETDAFGNVAQEAAASGVVPIVSDKGGPKYLIEHDVTGFIAKNISDFTDYASMLINDPARLGRMRKAARDSAMSRSWESIFEGVYDAYRESIRIAEARKIAAINGNGGHSN